jgi:RND family efflux transporter MFP subunit
MKLAAVALDYDGTIAVDGVMDPQARDAIAHLRIHGIAVVLVTGRRLSDLNAVAGDLECFNAVVAENGAVLYFPESQRHTVIGHAPPSCFLEGVRQLGIEFAVGDSIVETDEERLASLELDVRTREAQVKAAELAVQASEHEVDALRAVLRQFEDTAGRSQAALTLRSPVAGVVLRVHQESEALVAAGTPLIEVGNPDQLEIVADLLSTDAVRVQTGFPVFIAGWGGETTLHGSVRLVEPAGFTKISALGVEEQRVNVLIDFDDSARDAHRLGDGYRVDISIIIWERAGILKVPTSALFRAGDKWRVFAVHDGRVVTADIRIGQRNALEAEVISGLDQGDKVIVHPGDTIQDDVAVIQRDSS